MKKIQYLYMGITSVCTALASFAGAALSGVVCGMIHTSPVTDIVIYALVAVASASVCYMAITWFLPERKESLEFVKKIVKK